MREPCIPWVAIFLIGAWLGNPRPAKGEVVSIAVCAVGDFPCPAGALYANSTVINRTEPLVHANRYHIFQFPGAPFFSQPFASFGGRMMVSDFGGKFIYLWAESSVQNNVFSADATKLPNGFYFDVVYSQTYVTVSGAGNFSERLMGGCGALAQTPQNTILMQGIVSNATTTTLLPLVGSDGDCAQNLGGNVSASAGPYGVVTNSRTTLTVDVQFKFAPGTLGQGMGIPITDDYPDPNIPFTPDPDHIPKGLLLDAPEPAELTEFPVPLFMLLGLLALARRRR